MTDLVRVTLANGAQKSMPRRAAEAAGLKPLCRPAAHKSGQPLPTKHRVNKGGAESAETKKPMTAEASASPNAHKEG